MTTKRIVYTRPDGRMGNIGPAPGARLVSEIIVDGRSEVFKKPVPLDRLQANIARLKAAGVTVEEVFAETEDEFVARIRAKDVPMMIVNPPEGTPDMLLRAQAVGLGLSFVETPSTVVDETDLPDRWFRNAWTLPVGGGPIEIDMPKARAIQVKKIQIARRTEINILQAEEDEARMMDRTADANKHAADRAALETMNLTAVGASVAEAANPTALKAVWPAGLRPV